MSWKGFGSRPTAASLVLILVLPALASFAPASPPGPEKEAAGPFTFNEQMISSMARDIMAGAGHAGRGGAMSRGTQPVTINGTLANATGVRPALAIVAALDPNTYAIVNMTMTSDGNYSITVWNTSDYIFFVFTINGEKVGDYSLHGFFPQARFIRVENTTLQLDVLLEDCYEVVLEVYDTQGQRTDESNLSAIKWVTGSGKPMDKVRSEFAVWTGAGNSTSFTTPSVALRPNLRRDLWVLREVPGFGRVTVSLNNGSWGFGGPAGKGELVELNLEVARTLYSKAQDRRASYVDLGVPISTSTDSLIAQANTTLMDAMGTAGAQRAMAADRSANASLWALEAMELERASKGIEDYRKGDLTVTVNDMDGRPVPGANVTIDQSSRDFLYGVFDPIGDVGLKSYQMLKDIGLNYVTAGFYWSITEPTEGGFAFDVINDTIGVPHFKDMGLKVKAHANIYLLDLVIPRYVAAMNFTELKAAVYDHVHTLVQMYADDIDIWEIINEASGTGATLNMTRDQVLEIMRTGVQAIKDADPTARLLVNNGFSWYAEHLAGGYFLGIDENYTFSIPEFMDWLDANGLQYDIVGQQMYDGGYASFFEEIGLGPGMAAPTYEMSFISDVMDSLGKYGRPVHITEQSVSGSWNETNPKWRDAGYLHNKWSPQAQADFLMTYLTIIFSKQRAESFTWWDVSDNMSFMKDGGLMDNDLKPKPVFYALRDFIANHTTKGAWNMTRQDGTTDLRGYGGDYNVTVTKGASRANATVHITEQKGQTLLVTLPDYKVRPDLFLNASGVVMNSSMHNVDGTVLVNVTIGNDGETSSPAFTVRARIGDHGGTNRTAGPLDLGEVARASFTLPAENLSGPQNITIWLDPDGKVDETNETNNNVTIQVTLQPVPWGDVRFNVSSSSDGRPIEGAAVTMTPEMGQGAGNGTLYGITDADGTLAFKRQIVGGYYVLVDEPDFHLYDSSFNILSASTTYLDIMLEPILEGELNGTVRDGEGTLLPGAVVRVNGTDANVTSDAAGRYAIPGLKAATYNVTASKKDHFETTVQVEIRGNRTTTLDIKLRTMLGSIQGRVTDNSTHLPIEGVNITIPGSGNATRSGTDGAYRIDGVLEGTYRTFARKDGYFGTESNVTIMAGTAITADIAIDKIPEPPKFGSIEGYVSENGSGRPIPNATLRLGTTGEYARTGANGSYRLTDLEAGTYILTVEATGYETVNVTVDVTPGNTTVLDISLLSNEKPPPEVEEPGYPNVLLPVLIIMAIIGLVFGIYYLRKGRRGQKTSDETKDTHDRDVDDPDPGHDGDEDGTGDSDDVIDPGPHHKVE